MRRIVFVLACLICVCNARRLTTIKRKLHSSSSPVWQRRLEACGIVFDLQSVAKLNVRSSLSAARGLVGILLALRTASAFNPSGPTSPFPLSNIIRLGRIGGPNQFGLLGQLGPQKCPTWLVGALDKFAQVRIDPRTEDEYWVLPFPFLESFEFLRKDTSVAEIAVGGLAAGCVVEFAVAFLCHPFETVKTRLQAKPKQALERWPPFNRLYDGFGPVVLTVPALSIFWATRDAVRTSINSAVQESLPWPVLDVFSTSSGAIAGEAIYWMIKTPSQVLKTQQQVSALQGQFEEGDLSGVSLSEDQMDSKQFDIWRFAKAWPVLAIVDVPYVGLRVAGFTALNHLEFLERGFGQDILLFTLANVLAVMLTTPLDVVRTQMLLRGSAIQDLPAVVADIYEKDGILSFVAGWSPRLLYNGLIVGIVWGIVRQGYDGVRATFLLEILDRLEESAGSFRI